MTFQLPVAHLILHIFDDLPDPGQQKCEQRKSAQPCIERVCRSKGHHRRIRTMQELQLRRIRKSDQQRRCGCQKGDRQISDHEQTFVTAGIEPQQPRHNEYDNADGHAAKQKRHNNTQNHTNTAQYNAQTHRCRLVNGSRHNDCVRTVDTVYLDIEIIIDHISSGSNQHDGQGEQQHNIPRQYLAIGSLVEDRHRHPFFHDPYQCSQKEQICPSHEA